MTEAEAVEKSKEIVNMLKFWKNHGWISAIKIEKVREYFIALTISLNLIQTQQAEIEHLKQEKATAWEEWNNIDQYCDQEKQKYKAEIEKKDTLIHTMQAEFERLEDLEDNTDMLKLELKKKDKMIDEMATYIATLDIEEDICEKTKNEHCDQMNFGECEDCIKQYFERKVENGN